MNTHRILGIGSGVMAVMAVSSVACDKRTQNASTETRSGADAASPELRSGEMKPSPLMTATAGKETKPKDPFAAADSDMKKVLEELDVLGIRPITTLSPEEARKQPTPADAVKKLVEKKPNPSAVPAIKVDSRKIAGAAGQVDARIYVPETEAKKPLPVVVYFHGGGFVIGSLDAYDASARALADKASAIVVSADYRRGPEHKFPAAHDDAFAAYEWARKNAASLGGDPKRVAVAGESAGGNLAAGVSLKAREKGSVMPAHQLLVYPIAQTNMNTESYHEWEFAKPLNKASMAWFFEKYTRSPDDLRDPRLNLVGADLKGLPPTTIILAEIDPLRSEGATLADKLKEAGVKVDKKVYEGVTHEFFGMGAVVGDAREAVDFAGERLSDTFKR